ncbi:PAS domain-containing protein [Mycolicibacterium confluentis]|uniref:PAS domain-containing protein n=1 Tax=Mycolicibacterium confluentis TaxID=28047 RepID=UPI000A1660A8|nr:PAS domain-containing protein [Mycolicibacterium confluentis]MCV7320457.1 PAS domain-containing protein [Mycolicibacterium confluentis]ORV21826.1 hypothetical protein AWB99_05640 [Mycolicibacterium confluentis]
MTVAGGEAVRGLIVTALTNAGPTLSTSQLRRHLDENFNVAVMNETLYRSLAILEKRGEVVKLESRGRNALWKLSADADLTAAKVAPSREWQAGTDCIMIIRVDGTLLHANRAGCVAMKLPEDEVEFGMPWLELLPEEIRGRGLRALHSAVGGDRATFVGMTTRRGGSLQYWENLLSPIIDSDGQVRQILCIARDITADLHRSGRSPQGGRRNGVDRHAGSVRALAGIGGSFADRLNRLFAAIRAPGNGAYTNSEVLRALAEKGVHVSAPYMSQLRSGVRRRPSEQAVIALAEFFGVRPVYFDDAYDREDLQYLVRLDADLRWLQLAHDPQVRRIVTMILELPPDGQDEIREHLARAT